jgi:hypothetical protein
LQSVSHHPVDYPFPEEKKMRKLIAMLFASALVATSAYAVEPQQVDESTNPNTNTDLKTQNMQQKPNKDDDSTSSSSTHHKKGYRQPHSKKHQDSNSGSSSDSTTNSGSSSSGY